MIIDSLTVSAVVMLVVTVAILPVCRLTNSELSVAVALGVGSMMLPSVVEVWVLVWLVVPGDSSTT